MKGFGIISHLILIVIVVVGLTIQTIKADDFDVRGAEDRIRSEILGNGYDKYVRPFNGNETCEEPVEVGINFVVKELKVDSKNTKFEMTFDLWMQWLDPRLAYGSKKDGEKFSSITIPDEEETKVWRPPIFFSQERRGLVNDLVSPNMRFKILPHGHVVYHASLTITFSCPMDLSLYPHDKQKCTMKIVNFGPTAHDMVLNWIGDGPVNFEAELGMNLYSLEDFGTSYCDIATNNGIYSCLQLDLIVKRRFGGELMNAYAPFTFLVFLGWLSLWLEWRGPVGHHRLVFGVIILMLTCFYVPDMTQVNEGSIPWRAIDLYIGICFLFVLSTVLAYAVANSIENELFQLVSIVAYMFLFILFLIIYSSYIVIQNANIYLDLPDSSQEARDFLATAEPLYESLEDHPEFKRLGLWFC